MLQLHLHLCFQLLEVSVKEGYYWINHQGIVQVAYLTNDPVEDMETGKIVVGVWHLTQSKDICHNGEAEVLEGPLQPPQ